MNTPNSAQEPLTVHAGSHDRVGTPLSFQIDRDAAGLRWAASNEPVPCQTVDGRCHFILDQCPAGQERHLRFEEVSTGTPAAGVVLHEREDAGEIDIHVRGALFTTYHYGDVPFRPYFHPLRGPGGVGVTRDFPMVQGAAGETDDHPHHRSLWVAFGDVNGSDNWSEEATGAFQVHRGFNHIISGPVFGEFEQMLDWQDTEHRPVLQETRTFRVYNSGDEMRLADLTVVFRAGAGRVVFGDTKEGGICAVRVATSMDGDKGGRIENSAGGIGQAETWGKPAHWCDYSGPCQGQHRGIAVFDHPMNLRHPTTWHVRDYGLMGANCFGHSYYKSGLMTDGSYTLEADQLLTFNYRIFIHKGDAQSAHVSDRYHDYAHPPFVAADG